MTNAPAGAAPPMTAEQLLGLPDDDLRHELVAGVLTTMPPPGLRHGRVTLKIGRRLGNHVEEHGLGECLSNDPGIITGRDPDTVRAPDLAFFRAGRAPDPDEAGYAETVPDLVVEVVSPSDRSSEVLAKALMWVRAGVRLVWVVDPETRVVTVHRPGDVIGLLQGDAVLSGEDVVPGFSARLTDVFT